MTASTANAVALLGMDAMADDVDAGAGAGTLVIYENGGSNPADADSALGGATVLATLTFSDPAFGSAADGTPGAVVTANSITDASSAAATGTAHFFRIFDSDGNVKWQGACGTSGQELNLVSTSIVSGQPVSVTSLTITLPEAGS